MHEAPREGALGRSHPRVGIAGIALALVALFATLIADARALPALRQAGAPADAAAVELALEHGAGALPSVLAYIGGVEEDGDSDGVSLLTGTDRPSRYGGASAPRIVWVLAPERPGANKPTGPPQP